MNVRMYSLFIAMSALLIAGCGDVLPTILGHWEPRSHQLSGFDLSHRSLRKARLRCWLAANRCAPPRPVPAVPSEVAADEQKMPEQAAGGRNRLREAKRRALKCLKLGETSPGRRCLLRARARRESVWACSSSHGSER